MTSLNNKQRGFTIVELLIVIVVIGILAALVITTFNGIQQRGRDTERQTDIKALHGQLEAYYAQNGSYPTLAEMNDRTTNGFVDTNLKGLDAGAFEDPTPPATNPELLVASPVAKSYAYDIEPDACETDPATDCISYTLTATLEGQIDGSGTYVKDSLNN